MNALVPLRVDTHINHVTDKSNLANPSWKHIVQQGGGDSGGSLSMLFYAVVTLLLVQALWRNGQCFQSWYADDSVYADPLADVHRWLDRLSSLGLFYGYFPEPCKSYTHSVHHFSIWQFSGLGISVVSGHPFLDIAVMISDTVMGHCAVSWSAKLQLTSVFRHHSIDS